MSLSWSTTPSIVRTAGVAAVLGFVISIESSLTIRRDGRPVECTYQDLGALILGAIAITTGLVGLLVSWRQQEDRNIYLGICAASFLIGIWHILRGLGTIGGPCNL